MARTDKQARTYNGFAIPLQPGTELGLAMLIAEDDEGCYRPIAMVHTITEAKELAENDPDSHVGAMRAFNSIGWLCGRPRLPIIQPGSAIPEDGQYGPYEGLVKPLSWWLEGKAIAEQFESFLQFVGANPDTYQNSLGQLLTGTPIPVSVSAIAAYCRDEFQNVGSTGPKNTIGSFLRGNREGMRARRQCSMQSPIRRTCCGAKR